MASEAGLQPRESTSQLELSLLGPFRLQVDDRPVRVAHAGQRVVALLAVFGGSADRTRVAGTLWPTNSQTRAEANLRGALWRLPDVVSDAIDRSGSTISMGSRWRLDVDECVEQARDLRKGGADSASARCFTEDLLPAWDEIWLDLPRERHRQLRLHSLERLSAAQLDAGNGLDAVDIAMEAVIAEPLRESAQLLLVKAHLAAGNRVAAVRAYERFEALLRAELGVEPGPDLQGLRRSVCLTLP